MRPFELKNYLAAVFQVFNGDDIKSQKVTPTRFDTLRGQISQSNIFEDMLFVDV